MNKRLFLFTARYPYVGAENFMEDEINYLAKVFEEVYVIPYQATNKGCREMPSNCKLWAPVVRKKSELLFKGLYSKKAFRFLIKDLLKNNAFCSVKKLKVWLTAYVAVNSILNSTGVQHVGKELRSTDVCYFYWGKWSNILSVFWKDKAHFVSRFHGQWDLWEEEYEGYAPLRKSVSQSLDAAVFISQKGEKYFHKKYPECMTRLFRLGTKDIGIVEKSNDNILRVLSCSTVYPLKRVDLILQSVAEVSKAKKVEWTHLGGGEDYDKIKKMADQMANEKLGVKMLGQMSYADVMAYYKNNPFDIFINLSTNEGVPVSIMEAISCDVPIVATNVGGTSEIVNDQTGILVSNNPTAEEVALAILKVAANKDKYSPRVFWENNYMADNNYMQFAEFLKSM